MRCASAIIGSDDLVGDQFCPDETTGRRQAGIVVEQRAKIRPAMESPAANQRWWLVISVGEIVTAEDHAQGSRSG